MNTPFLSLCIPTNGIIEWVFPVLDSIYIQNVNNDLFEVVVTNNGDNEEFHSKMCEYEKKHGNLIYKKTDSYMFYNQLDALRLASGEYFKFINHRSIMEYGSIDKMISIIKENMDEKPVMYFSNSTLKDDYELDSFDKFVASLGRYASWTTGVGIWKSDFNKLPKDIKVDKISPHSCILFAEKVKRKYCIFNFLFSKEIETDHSRKGTYDLFKAFGIEELSITQNLYIDDYITAQTLKHVKKDYRNFIASLYWQFCVKKDPCSYELSGFEDAMGVYFNKYDIIIRAYLIGIKRMICKILKK